MEPDRTDDVAVSARASARAGRGARPAPVMAIAGVVLVVLGLAFWVAHHFTVGDERHSYSSAATAPRTVHVTLGKTYHLSVHDGVQQLARLGLAPGLVSCRYTSSGTAARTLTITPESDQTKAIDQFATFVAPTDGRIHITCSGVPDVFVDNADDAGYDRSGLFLLLAVVGLAIGLPLLLSALRRWAGGRPASDYDPAATPDWDGLLPPPPASTGTARQHDEVERGVD